MIWSVVVTGCTGCDGVAVAATAPEAMQDNSRLGRIFFNMVVSLSIVGKDAHVLKINGMSILCGCHAYRIRKLCKERLSTMDNCELSADQILWRIKKMDERFCGYSTANPWRKGRQLSFPFAPLN
jgi:hypothetical protein